MSLIKIGELINKPQKIVSPEAILDPTYVFGETINEELYVDITSNNNLMSIGLYEYDYLFCREQIKLRSASMDVNDPKMADELKCASQFFCVAKSTRDMFYSEEEQEKFWMELIYKTQNTRLERWSKAKSYISYILPSIYSIDLAKSTTALSQDYITYGIESFLTHGVDGLFDWIESTSEFSGGTGFNGKSYWSQIYQDKLISILRIGK